MANWHYYNKNGEKVGPISVAALKSLAQQGMITRDTVLENHTGRTLIAGEVNGLTFPEAATPLMSSPQPTMPPPVQPVVSPVVVPSSEPNPFPALTSMENDPFSSFPTLTSDVDPFAASPPQPVSWDTTTSTPAPSRPNIPLKPIIFGGIGFVVLLLVLGGVWIMSSPSRFATEEQTQKDNADDKHNVEMKPQEEIDKFLAEHGSDVKAIDDSGNTLLHKAARNNSIHVVKFLVEKGADIHTRNDSDNTPLHYAALNENVEVAKFLVEKGADLNAKTTGLLAGLTPVHYAASNENAEIIKFLVEKGADIRTRTEDGSTSLHYAASNENVEVAKFLVEKGLDVNAKTEDGGTPLHNVARNKNIEITKFLVEKGADVNAKETGVFAGRTPLHEVALSNENVEVVKFLVEKGADLNAKTTGPTVKDLTPLHNAAWNKNAEIIKYLVEKGADIHTRNDSDNTPLHYAALNENVEVAKFLVEKGADVNAKDYKTNTPLQKAKERKNTAVVEYLASLPTTTVAPSLADMGFTSAEQVEIGKFCTKHGDDVKAVDEKGETLLHKAVWDGHIAVVKYLISKGADVNAVTKNESGKTPLLSVDTSDYSNWAEIVKLLLANGADIDATDKKYGYALLHSMMLYGITVKNRVEFIRFLIANGADVNIKKVGDETPLHMAASLDSTSDQEMKVEIVKLLLANGADVNAMNDVGETPLHRIAGW